MHGLTSPTSPEALRRETVWAYSCGWPPSFLGDLHYYIVDHDLARGGRDDRHVALPGAHPHRRVRLASATIEHGQEVHDAIAGSTFDVMEGVGHFPMAENPAAFIPRLLPILDDIRKNRS